MNTIVCYSLRPIGNFQQTIAFCLQFNENNIFFSKQKR